MVTLTAGQRARLRVQRQKILFAVNLVQCGLKQLMVLSTAEGMWLRKRLCERDLLSLCSLSIPLHYCSVYSCPSGTRPKATNSFHV